MIEEKSGGRLKVTIFPGGTLGKPADHFDLVKNGIADMGFAAPGYTPGRFPLISVTELPLLFKTSKGGSQAVWSLFDKYFKTEFTGVKVLWIWVIPPGHVHLAKKPVRVLEDLAGLKIRAGTPMLGNMVKALGGTPVNIAAPETYNALERGVVDGTIFPWEAIYSFNLAEVLRYHAVVDLCVAPLITLMNQKRYDSLPPDLRKVIDELSGVWGCRVHRHHLGPEREPRNRGGQEGGGDHLHRAARRAPALGGQAQGGRGRVGGEHGSQGAARSPDPQ